MFLQRYHIKNILLIILVIYSVIISCGIFFQNTNTKPVEYISQFNTEDISLNNFTILVSEDYVYIPNSYYFQRQTNQKIDNIVFELLLDDQIIFEFNVSDPFFKDDTTLPMFSKIIKGKINDKSNLTIHMSYKVDGKVNDIYEKVKMLRN